MAYRMTPARRAALRRAQAASARKRKGRGRGRKPGNASRRARIKAGAKLAGVAALYVGAHAAGTAASRHQSRKRSEHRGARNRAATERMVRRHTGSSTRTVHGARAHGGGPSHSNRVFVTTKHGTTSVRRKHH